ncbi:GntR family transcriptional regulator [Carnobacteriaceae bacterium 52-44]|jgi:GntR family transcriptional regulator
MGQTLYIQLSEKLIDKINNEMEVGDLLPSERKLTEIYDVSRTTVRLALDNLETRGYISRQHGKGSFVVDYHKTLINLSDMYSFTEQMKAIGQTPNTKLISYSIVNSTELLNDIFKNNETKFIKLVRLRSSDNIPMLYEESYIPYSKFNQITEEDIDKRSLYDIFLEDYNEVVKLAQEEFSAGIASQEEAKQLEIKEHSAVLKIYRTTINIKNEVIEYTESKARPDKFSYRTVHHNRLAF